jgi:hypothetical protein
MSSHNEQIDKFCEAARQLETDDNENRFAHRLGKIAKPTPRVVADMKRDQHDEQKD